MTIQLARSCQIIRQNSLTVTSVGPWVTMYALGFSKLCNQNEVLEHNIKYNVHNKTKSIYIMFINNYYSAGMLINLSYNTKFKK